MCKAYGFRGILLDHAKKAERNTPRGPTGTGTGTGTGVKPRRMYTVYPPRRIHYSEPN